MKEALAKASLGEAFRYNSFQFSGQELNLPKPSPYKFKTDEQLAVAKAAAEAAQRQCQHLPQPSQLATEVPARKKLKTDPASASSTHLDDTTMLGIEHLDMALASASSRLRSERAHANHPSHASTTNSSLTDPNIMALDADLDLSNLDDLFDGDTMLGDDMLPL